MDRTTNCPTTRFVHIGSNEMLSYRVGRSLCHQRNAYRIAISRSMRHTAVDVHYAEMQDVHTFSDHYLRNRSTLDIGVLDYIGIV